MKAKKLPIKPMQSQMISFFLQGFTYDVVAQWGDKVGDSRFGYNNDYLSFIETSPGQGYLTVNFEYISGRTWLTNL
jgi:secreted PhoX family phosphatase